MSDPRSPALQWVYPPSNHVTHETSVLLVGQAIQAHSVTIAVNNEAPHPLLISATPNGYFGGRTQTPLQEGVNTLTLSATRADGTVMATKVREVTVGASLNRTVVNPTGHLMLQASHPVFRLQAWLSPLANLPNTSQEVIKASLWVNGQPVDASLCIGTDNGWIESREAVFAKLHQTSPKISTKHWVSGLVRLPKDLLVTDAECVITLRLSKSQSSIDYPLDLRLTTVATPLWANIRPNNGATSAVTRCAPNGQAERLTPLLANTWGQVYSVINGWACLRWSAVDDNNPYYQVWVCLNDLTISSEGQASLSLLQPATLPMLVLDANPKDNYCFTVLLPLPNQSSPPPFDCQVMDGQLILTLHHTQSHCHFVTEHIPPNSGIRLSHRPLTIGGQTSVEVVVNVARLIGYDIAFVPMPETILGNTNSDDPPIYGLQLTVVTLPKTIAETTILLDPGHGGDEYGAIAPDGTPEKTLNLALAKHVQAQLLLLGFTNVSLTRYTDCTLSLSQRISIAQQQRADIVLSIHHNALPDGRNPLQHEGPVCLYWQAPSQSLAWTIQQALQSLWGHQTKATRLDTVYKDSLVMTRIHTGLAVLVEAGYLTHPHDAERLLNNNAFLETWARTLSRAVKQWVMQA
jgi:N-acetylmuramoyl-L-alanine amidase